MFGASLATACMLLALVVGAVADGDAMREAPPAAHTGGFDEATCQDCHFEAEPNTGPGRVTLTGLPAQYAPGAAYRLTVTLVQKDLKVGGFQLSARDPNGAQAGTLAPADTQRTRVTVAGDVAYIHHVLAGTAPVGPDTARWSFVWTAPRSGVEVRFHIAANAANDDGSPLGDLVYLLEQRAAATGKQP